MLLSLKDQIIEHKIMRQFQNIVIPHGGLLSFVRFLIAHLERGSWSKKSHKLSWFKSHHGSIYKNEYVKYLGKTTSIIKIEQSITSVTGEGEYL